jgi:DNA-binding XRE family transcriptional regulator
MTEDREENLVKKVCNEYNITQTELAKRLDIPRGTVGRWSSDGNIPRGIGIALNLMLENKELKNKLVALKLFKDAIKALENI